jgi:methionine-rich copper-binding protein CopC
MIRQWIIDGAQKPQALAHAEARPSFEVVATSPADTAVLDTPVDEIVVAFSGEVDAAVVNGTTVELEPVAGTEFPTPSGPPIPTVSGLAPGNPATILIHPAAPLGAGTYRVTLRGTGGAGALASVSGVLLGADYDFAFTVETAR